MNSKELFEKGRLAGQGGKYSEAIDYFEKAHEMDPDWPYPVYEMAYTYLLQKDYENALKYYKITDKLEPKGFFTSKVAIWSLEKEKEGVFPQGLYLKYLMMEFIPEKEQRLELIKEIIERDPNFVPAWKDLGSLLEDNEERLKVIESGLKLDSDIETKGFLLLNKALVFINSDRKDQGKEILEDLNDGGYTKVVENWADKILLQL